MKHPLSLLLISALSIASSCSNDAPVEVPVMTAEQIAAQAVTAAADSIERLKAGGKMPWQQKNESLKFSTPAEALDYMKQSGHWDEYSQGILPGIAGQCLDYANKLLSSPFPYFIIADKGRMTVTVYDRYGRSQISVKMACSRYFGSKHKFRDNRTPEGFFEAEGAYDAREWLYTDDDGVTSDAKGVYGPRFIRLLTPVTRSVGIHGTNSPNSPGLRCSHGCMRLHNSNIVKVVKYVRKGTPIIVNPSRRDDEVNRQEGYRIPMLALDLIRPGQLADPLPDRPVASPEEVEKARKEAEAAEQAAKEAEAARKAKADSAGLNVKKQEIPDLPSN